MTPCEFEWQPDAAKRYTVNGGECKFNAGGTDLYRPVAASTTFAPNTGKHYYELVTNCDNMRLGLATDDADLDAEMGKGNGLYSLDLQTGSCCIAGEEKKRLWRLIVSVSGGRFGFCWDSDQGVLQVWFNGEFAGTCFHKDFGLEGKAVRPICGIAGIEDNNRDIGTGMKAVVCVKPNLIPKPVLSH
eukprot:CAMPEP_0174850152 /NCGR_PEP_ID=MMETSP1114-20130205/19071_1 /TAXON_ID=312471 /ORGANISM="Neobodo designis, Strain CCAP 1951/1" /LENGTH=186 /DNA_ID=CAMNT_0016084589 /DNA_START=77 /DNA_END=637 /DNA_ORIENTATION=-